MSWHGRMTRPRDVVPWPSILGAASGVAAVGLVFVGGRAMLVRQAALARRRIGKPLDENALDVVKAMGYMQAPVVVTDSDR